MDTGTKLAATYFFLVYIVIDADNMDIHSVIQLTDTAKPYAIDRIGNTLLSIARGFPASERIDIIPTPDNYELEHHCVQPLKHSPRAARGNSSGDKALISGGDVALSTVLDMSCDCGCIELEVGNPRSKRGTGAASGIDYGGGSASGHEFWIDDHRIAVLDRVRREVLFYDLTLGDPQVPIFTLELTTIPHHLARRPSSEDKRIFISCEGSPSRFLPPSIFVINETAAGFKPIGQKFLPVAPGDLANSGGHHFDFDVLGDYLYMGSAEGQSYVFETKNLDLVAQFETGRDHGHTGFVSGPDRTYGATINHKDIFTTVIDADRWTKICDVPVTTTAPVYEPDKKRTKLAQGHTSFRRMRDGKPYFYLMVPHQSEFVEIDLSTQIVTRRLDVACHPKIKEAGITELYMVQGTQIAEVDTSAR